MNLLSANHLSRSFAVRSATDHRWQFWRPKTFKTAITDISFGVEAGETIGYLGPNGAGKSTTIKILTGVLRPTGGEVLYRGKPIWHDRNAYLGNIGCVFGQRSQLVWDLPVRRSFDLLQSIYDLSQSTYRSRLAELADALDLLGLINTPVRQLSLGQRMRCEIAAALIHSPSLLFLDEPTIGLDITARQRTREFLAHENARKGTAVLITSHNLKDIEHFCQRILVIDKGRLIFDGNADALKRRVAGYRMLVLDTRGPLPDRLPEGVTLAKTEGGKLWLHFPSEQYTVMDLLDRVGRSCEIRDISVQEPDLEEVLGTLYDSVAAD